MKDARKIVAIAKVERSHYPWIQFVKIVLLACINLKTGKERVNPAMLVHGVIQKVVRHHPIARNATEERIHQLPVHLL